MEIQTEFDANKHLKKYLNKIERRMKKVQEQLFL